MKIYLKTNKQNKWEISSSVFRHYTYAYKNMYFNYHSKQNLDWNYSRDETINQRIVYLVRKFLKQKLQTNNHIIHSHCWKNTNQPFHGASN